MNSEYFMADLNYHVCASQYPAQCCIMSVLYICMVSFALTNINLTPTFLLSMMAKFK